MACNLIPAGFGANACAENFSGVGGTAYLFLKSEMEIDELTKLPKAPSVSDSANEFTTDSFPNLKVYPIKLKKKANKVDWTNNPNGGGYTNTVTLVVADDMDSMSFNGRTLNNIGGDFGVMIPKSTADGLNSYYVVYNHEFGCEFTNEGTTGDAPDSDHGHTITIAATMYYGPMTWTGSFGEVVSADTTAGE